MKKNIIKLITCSLIILLHTYSFAMQRLPQLGGRVRIPPTRTQNPFRTLPAPKSEIKPEKSSERPSGGSAVPARGSQATSSVPPAVIRPHFGGRARRPLFEHTRKDLSMQAVKQRSQSLRESEYPASYIVDSFNTDKFTEAEREEAFQTAIDLAQKEGYVIGIVYKQAENSMRYIRKLCNVAEGEAENYVPYPYEAGNETLFECIFTPDALIYMIRPLTGAMHSELIYPEGENILELQELGSGPKVPPKAFNTLRKIQDNKAAQELSDTIETLTQQTEALQAPAIVIEPIPDVPAEISPATIEPQQPAKPIAYPEIEILEKVIKKPQIPELIAKEEPIIVKRIESAPDRFVKTLSTKIETSGLAPEAIAHYQQEIDSVMKKPLMGPAKKLELLEAIEKNIEDAKTLKNTADLAEQNRIKELQEQELNKARLDLQEKENVLEKATQKVADAQEVLGIVKKTVDIQTENVKNTQQKEIELQNTQKELLEQLSTEEREVAELKQQQDAAERVKTQSDALELAKKEEIEKQEKLKAELDKQIAAMEAREEAENKLNRIAENIHSMQEKPVSPQAPETHAPQPTDILPIERISPAEKPERHREAEAAQGLTTALEKTQRSQFKNIQPAPEARAQQPTDILPKERISPAEEPEYHLEAEAAKKLTKLTTALKETQPAGTKQNIPSPAEQIEKKLAEPTSKEPIRAEKPEYHLETQMRAQELKEAADKLNTIVEKIEPLKTKESIKHEIDTVKRSLIEPVPKQPIRAEEPAPHIEAEMRAQELKEAADKLAAIVEKIEPLKTKESIKHEIDTVKQSLIEPAPKQPSQITEEVPPHPEAEELRLAEQEKNKNLLEIQQTQEQINKAEAKKLATEAERAQIKGNIKLIDKDIQAREKALEETQQDIASQKQTIEDLALQKEQLYLQATEATRELTQAQQDKIDLEKAELQRQQNKALEDLARQEQAQKDAEKALQEAAAQRNTLVKVEKTIEQNIQKQDEIINNIQEQEAQARQNLRELEQNQLEKIEKQKTEINKRDNDQLLEDIAREERRERPELAKKYAEQFELPQGGGDDGDDEREKEEPQQQLLPESPEQAEPKNPTPPQKPRAKDTREKETPTPPMQPTEPVAEEIPPASKKPREQLQTEPAEEYVSPATYVPETSTSTASQGGIRTPVQGFELHGTPYTTHTAQSQRPPHFAGTPSGRTPYTPSPTTPSYPISSFGGYTSYEMPTPPEPIVYGEQPQQRLPETHALEKIQEEDINLLENPLTKTADLMPARVTKRRLLKEDSNFIKHLIFKQLNKPTAPAPEETNATDTVLIDTKKPEQPTKPSLGKKIKTFTTNIINTIQKWFGW